MDNPDPDYDDELLLYLTRILVAVSLPDCERPEQCSRAAA
ncbi:Uncharacterised protein [Mycolicibacterium vanbaalenii]|uniref:Uncharacterized protein n=1 Tax=Mycolicibacterium vanbaalenii TaxID=110539 RepID=A0A5S9MN59_MYCVN|nr:Uncharacterised protein [Mycolicibacterium vanbaalenii]